jgi:hypothetical protein
MTRTIVHKTRGYGHGPIVRLMSPSDLGERLKPFVFLDLFEADMRALTGSMPLHPHSGIATVTVFSEGDVTFDDHHAGHGTIAYGGVEWARAGRGMWHGKELSAGTSPTARGFQLWIALPPDLETADSESPVALNYSRQSWRAVAFYGRPVVTRDRELFDDDSTRSFTISGGRVERGNVGRGKLSVFAAQLRNDNAVYVAAAGRERRNVFDVRYAGRSSRWDWDVEGMGQGGRVGAKKIRAWGLGALFGHTWASHALSPRLGLQFDAASGTDDPSGGTLGTFNPLFPSGYYELRAGFPGWGNFWHLKPSAMVRPTRHLSVLFTGGSVWRTTTADAVYLFPATPVLGTAGRGGLYSGRYAQARLDWNISPHLTAAIDSVYLAHSRSLRQAGARNGHFVELELRLGI